MKTQNQITITQIETIEQFESLREEWNALLFQCAEKDVFLTWEWQFAWWKNIGQFKYQLRILLFHAGGQLIGIAPFMISQKRKFRFHFRWLENIGNPECDVSAILSVQPEKTAFALLEYLQEKKQEWDVLELMEVNATTTGNQKILKILEDSQYGFWRTKEEHFYIPLAGNTWEAYYNQLSKNMKHNLKRRRKRISELGAVSFKKYSGSSLTWEAFQKMRWVSEKSNFPDLYKFDNVLSFHQDLLVLMKEPEWAQIEMLFIDERPIAFQYGFLFDNKYEDWRGGIDKEFETLAPGKLLMMFSLAERFKLGLRESDFLRGVYAYKMDWNPQSREYANMQLYNTASIKSKLAYWWAAYLKPSLEAWRGGNKQENANQMSPSDEA
jgi:CelD/BcsL family acetyltransferase involved in cellulose biosynthesis